MSEHTIGGKRYSVGKVDTFTQLHLARKLGPSIPIIDGLIDHRNAEKNKDLLTVLMFSHISDTDVEFVIRKCLSVVHRRQDDGKPVNIDLSQMMEITVKVINENLGDFFRTALASMDAPTETPA
jgi:hypothetical protein